ncbi:hypothetical protein GBF38_020898 [Nibea albiflora]|uniref:Uncharacterized protein n=1 Tax=Nibea albiflora TaxID=240163 RepID=A0ACB7FFW8_NIBAL|nr:hypothetical protein GBF38_020898 [Nibea albiflora]
MHTSVAPTTVELRESDYTYTRDGITSSPAMKDGLKYPKGDKKGSTEAPFLNNERIVKLLVRLKRKHRTPSSCVVTEWAEWDPCSVTCGLGMRRT